MFGSVELLSVLKSGVTTMSRAGRNRELFPEPLQGLDAVRPHDGWSKVKVPGMFICYNISICMDLNGLNHLLEMLIEWLIFGSGLFRSFYVII